MKKILSLILALLMSASCASMIFADEAVTTAVLPEDAPADVVDVEKTSPYYKALKFLNEQEIVKGDGDSLLADDLLKRWEMAIFSARVATGWTDDYTWENGDSNNTKFTDLEGTYAEKVYGALSYANQKGIVVGYEDGTFKPEKVVTYREALTMAVRTLGYGAGYNYP